MPQNNFGRLLSIFSAQPRQRRMRKGTVNTSCLESLETRALLAAQVLSTTPTTLNASAGGEVAFDVVLDTTPANTKSNGIAFALHYDSTKLTFVRFDNVLQTGLQFAPGVPANDTGNTDGIAATDRRIPNSWTTFTDITFPPGLPVTMFRAVFTANASFTTGPTQIGFSQTNAAVDSTGAPFTFQSTPLAVTSVANTTPIARNDSFAVQVGRSVTGNVITNANPNGADSDANGGILAISTTPATAPTKGTLVLNANGSFTYTAFANVTGNDTFAYTLSDGQGGTATGTVTVAISQTPPITGDGNVRVSYSNGNLRIKGDNGNNSIVITGTATSVTVAGLGNTTINGKTTPFVIPVSQIAGSMSVSMSGGNDTVGIKNLNVHDGIGINLGSGDDQIGFTGVKTGRHLVTRAGFGNDAVFLNTTVVGRSALLVGGPGNDAIGLNASTIAENLVVRGKRGSDASQINANVSVGGRKVVRSTSRLSATETLFTQRQKELFDALSFG